ncbi:MAG: hypothetical protein MI810_00055 [Flavobacteriales bacterium]|nr:hypothetical protein [Flavobacteriales bacterium]
MRLLFLFFFLLTVSAAAQPTTEVYFEAFLSNDNAQMKKMETELKTFTQTPKIRAQRGALLAKIAMSEKDKSTKVRNFNMGKEMLEKQLRDNKENVEYRFMRLCIQTFCSGMNYEDNIQDDKKMILDHFSELEEALKNIIRTYARTSPVFKDEVLE